MKHWNIIGLIVRLILLGLIIYMLLSYVQDSTTNFSNETKIVISVVVVLIYAVIDVIWSKLAATGEQMCQLIC